MFLPGSSWTIHIFRPKGKIVFTSKKIPSNGNKSNFVYNFEPFPGFFRHRSQKKFVLSYDVLGCFSALKLPKCKCYFALKKLVTFYKRIKKICKYESRLRLWRILVTPFSQSPNMVELWILMTFFAFFTRKAIFTSHLKKIWGHNFGKSRTFSTFWQDCIFKYPVISIRKVWKMHLKYKVHNFNLCFSDFINYSAKKENWKIRYFLSKKLIKISLLLQ